MVAHPPAQPYDGPDRTPLHQQRLGLANVEHAGYPERHPGMSTSGMRNPDTPTPRRGNTGLVTAPASQEAWDLDRIRQIVTENDLERGRIEYKRQLDNGRKTLEAITALANTFGGVVLVGVDETKQGLDRLTGVPAAERARLVSLCWSQLTPPFNPEIIPISLGHDDLYVLGRVSKVSRVAWTA